MEEIKFCKYDHDNDTLHVNKADGCKLSIMCAAVEYCLKTITVTNSKLIWLKENEPSTYAELYITGRLQAFLGQYGGSWHRQQKAIEKQLIEHFSGDEVYSASIAREIMMYGG